MTQPTNDASKIRVSEKENVMTADEDSRSSSGLWEIIRTVIYALLIAFVFRTVLFQPFSIPSGSMKSTLLIGDYLFVSKYSYGYSKYSLPLGSRLPSFGRVFSSEPERGDVIVFRNPTQNQDDYIKRLVGLPRDRIQVRNGRLFINEVEVDVKRAGDFIEPIQRIAGNTQQCITRDRSNATAAVCAKQAFVETLPNGKSYTILNAGLTRFDNTGVFVVPDGHYFFMGDNRDNSQDSRSPQLGFVPFEYLIGRAEFILVSSDGAFWEVWKWRFDRFFKSIE